MPYGETCRVSGVALGERKTCLQVAFLMALLSKVLLRLLLTRVTEPAADAALQRK